MSCMNILFKMVWCKRGEGGRGREREGKKREPEGEGGRWIWVNDTRSQYGHSVPCMTILL